MAPIKKVTKSKSSYAWVNNYFACLQKVHVPTFFCPWPILQQQFSSLLAKPEGLRIALEQKLEQKDHILAWPSELFNSKMANSYFFCGKLEYTMISRQLAEAQGARGCLR